MKVVKAVYETIDKQTYPDAVLFGEFRASMDSWTKPLIEAGIVDYIDGAALHQYGVTLSSSSVNPVHLPEDDSVTAGIKKLRELLDENGGEDKPIWLTETGYTSSINRYGVTEYEQAIYLPRLLCSFISEGAEKLFWYDLLDDGVTDYADKGATHENHFGLLRSKQNSLGAYSPKPAYVTYGVLTRVLDGKTFREKEVIEKGEYSLNKYNVYRYIFEDGTSETSALCTNKSSATVTLITGDTLKVTDLMGRCSELVPENGEVSVTVNGEMIYIDGEFSIK